MSNFTYTDYPGFGVWVRDRLHYRQAVRVGPEIHCSGQDGWIFDTKNSTISFSSSLAEEIDQAFQNVNLVLRSAGGQGWKQVYRLNSYHVEMDDNVGLIMRECFDRYLGRHQCIWTQIGVGKLRAEGMRVKLEVVAYVGE